MRNGVASREKKMKIISKSLDFNFTVKGEKDIFAREQHYISKEDNLNIVLSFCFVSVAV